MDRGASLGNGRDTRRNKNIRTKTVKHRPLWGRCPVSTLLSPLLLRWGIGNRWPLTLLHLVNKLSWGLFEVFLRSFWGHFRAILGHTGAIMRIWKKTTAQFGVQFSKVGTDWAEILGWNSGLKFWLCWSLNIMRLKGVIQSAVWCQISDYEGPKLFLTGP